MYYVHKESCAAPRVVFCRASQAYDILLYHLNIKAFGFLGCWHLLDSPILLCRVLSWCLPMNLLLFLSCRCSSVCNPMSSCAVCLSGSCMVRPWDWLLKRASAHEPQPAGLGDVRLSTDQINDKRRGETVGSWDTGSVSFSSSPLPAPTALFIARQ